MITYDLIKIAIKENLPMLITGKTGTGKSSLVKQAAEEISYDLYDFRLTGIMPEDIGGLPRPNGDCYEYLMPDWFAKRMGKPFVLFLDEINQASIQVLHALYGVVLDRMVAGKKNPEMRIVAACNGVNENEYVTDMMKPLLARFPIRIEHKQENSDVERHLVSKYPGFEKIIDIVIKSGKEISARDIEFGIKMLSAGITNYEVLNGCFGELTRKVLEEKYVVRNKDSEDEKMKEINNAANIIKTGNVMFGGVAIPVDKQSVYDGLSSDESRETVKLLVGDEQ